MIFTMFRVLFGFSLACLAAGFTTVMFALGSADLASGDPERMTRTLEFVALTATHSAVFSAPFALLWSALSEWQSVRGAVSHAAAGLTMAMAGFAVQYFSETPGSPTVASQYPLMAYAVTGLVAGLVYWLFAGRRAGSQDDIYQPVPATASASSRRD